MSYIHLHIHVGGCEKAVQMSLVERFSEVRNNNSHWYGLYVIQIMITNDNNRRTTNNILRRKQKIVYSEIINKTNYHILLV